MGKTQTSKTDDVGTDVAFGNCGVESDVPSLCRFWNSCNADLPPTAAFCHAEPRNGVHICPAPSTELRIY